MQAIDELRRLGYRVELDGGEIVCHFVGIATEPDRARVIPLLREIRAGRSDAVARLQREAAEAWPPESYEAEARFGHRAARLYPLLGRRVETPHGPAILQQVTEARCRVAVDGDEGRSIEVPADLVRPVHRAGGPR